MMQEDARTEASLLEKLIYDTEVDDKSSSSRRGHEIVSFIANGLVNSPKILKSLQIDE